MSVKGKKVFGLLLAVVIVGGMFTSCKSHHELCPAYTKTQTEKSSHYSA